MAENENSQWKFGLAWDPTLETGNGEIDAQHKQLFRLTSDLVEVCMSDKPHAAVSQTLDFLTAYTVQHFSDEEALQLQYGFPEYVRHKLLHDDFKDTVNALVVQFRENGTSADLFRTINSVVVRWLIGHIRQEDSKIAAHIRFVEGR